MAKNKIKQERLKKGLTQNALAKLIGTSQQQIDLIEKDKIRLTIDWIRKIADGLKVPPLTLMPEELLPEEMITSESDTAEVLNISSEIDRRLKVLKLEMPLEDRVKIIDMILDELRVTTKEDRERKIAMMIDFAMRLAHRSVAPAAEADTTNANRHKISVTGDQNNVNIESSQKISK